MKEKTIEQRLLHVEAECRKLNLAVDLLRRMVKENSGAIRDFLLSQMEDKKDKT